MHRRKREMALQLLPFSVGIPKNSGVGIIYRSPYELLVYDFL